MAMKQGISQTQQQKQIQRLAMTQTLQQSIQMLQYNVEELQDFLQQKELENPLISVEVSDQTNEFRSSSVLNSEAHDALIEQAAGSSTQSLFDYLLDQVHLTLRDTPLRQLVQFLLDYVDENGYLQISNEDIIEKTGASLVSVNDAVTLLQQLDPPGVGARDLRESLMLQTENDEGSPRMAYLVLEENFDELVNREWDKIAKKYDMSLSDVQEVFDYVRTLTPNPGAAFSPHESAYVIPDLILFEDEVGALQLQTTRAAHPRVEFQSAYFSQLRSEDNQEVVEYISEKKSEYEWIAKSLNQREETILRVGKIITNVQLDYFKTKSKELKPLLLRDVANKLHLHESTISRAVNGKYIATPIGTFELKKFFSNAVSNENNEISSDAVKQRIARLVEEEDKAKPISDAKIGKILEEKNIKISRRTVAKYRESLDIPSSSKRKRFE